MRMLPFVRLSYCCELVTAPVFPSQLRWDQSGDKSPHSKEGLTAGRAEHLRQTPSARLSLTRARARKDYETQGGTMITKNVLVVFAILLFASPAFSQFGQSNNR